MTRTREFRDSSFCCEHLPYILTRASLLYKVPSYPKKGGPNDAFLCCLRQRRLFVPIRSYIHTDTYTHTFNRMILWKSSFTHRTCMLSLQKCCLYILTVFLYNDNCKLYTHIHTHIRKAHIHICTYTHTHIYIRVCVYLFALYIYITFGSQQ